MVPTAKPAFTPRVAKFILLIACLVLASCGGGDTSSSAGTAAAPAGSSSTASTLAQAALASGSNPAAPVPAATASATGSVVKLIFSPAAVLPGQTAVLNWTSANVTSCDASEEWSGTQDTTGTLNVSQQNPGTYNYALSCIGAGGRVAASAVLTVSDFVDNIASVTVDSGPGGITKPNINVPYVDVTICVPNTAVCQTIDHVIVDTASFGLRIIAPDVVDPSLSPSLPIVASAATNNPFGECAVFGSGFMWGSVRKADVKIAGLTAPGIHFQLTGDPVPELANIPGSCSSRGVARNTVAALGAKGILGVGMETYDCGNVCVNSSGPGLYYTCSATGCTPAAIPLAFQVVNPVTTFPSDNNGVALNFPLVPITGETSATGSLIFGIGTRSNNQLGTAKIYAVDARNNFITTYKGKAFTNSFIDSGSNLLYFSDDSIPTCPSSPIYCPDSPILLQATTTSADGATTDSVNFSLAAPLALPGTIRAADLGALDTTRFDWGLPFFYGHPVFTAIRGANTPAGAGPYWAY